MELAGRPKEYEECALVLCRVMKVQVQESEYVKRKWNQHCGVFMPYKAENWSGWTIITYLFSG